MHTGMVLIFGQATWRYSASQYLQTAFERPATVGDFPPNFGVVVVSGTEISCIQWNRSFAVASSLHHVSWRHDERSFGVSPKQSIAFLVANRFLDVQKWMDDLFPAA